MKVGVIGAGTMGQGIAKAFAQVDGYEVHSATSSRSGLKAERTRLLRVMQDLLLKRK